MKFGEKVRTARLEAGLSQKKLAQMTGISLRTIQNYERGERMPKKREYYTYLADALHIELDSLIDDNADLVRRSAEHYGSRGQKQAMALTQQVSALFSSGRLENGEMDAMMKAIQDAYWDAKGTPRTLIKS